MDQTQAAPEAHITYYGGKWVAFAPILLAIVGLIYIAVKQADVPEYWVVFLLPMIVCLFLAKDKTAYCEAIIEGATNKVGGILIMAVLLAGICGQLVCQAVEQRCLARAVAAQKAIYLAFFKGEGAPLQHLFAAIGLFDVL